MLRDTQAQYKTMLQAKRRAENSIDAVLTMFNGQVLFLRHNLNACAIHLYVKTHSGD